MKGRPINIFFCIGVVQNVNGVIGPVEVVVVHNNFCCDVSRLKCRPQAVFNKIALLFGRHVHTRVIARVQRFVLWGDGCDANALGLHSLYVFYKIFRVGIIVFGL